MQNIENNISRIKEKIGDIENNSDKMIPLKRGTQEDVNINEDESVEDSENKGENKNIQND